MSTAWRQHDVVRALKEAKAKGEAQGISISREGVISILHNDGKSEIVSRPTGLVYVIGFSSYVKIGYTINLSKRISALQVGLPEKLIVYGTIENVGFKEEKRQHKRFRKYRLEGEWFRKEGELAAWIEAGCPK